VTATTLDDRARLPRPIAFVIVGAILGATLLALFWPALPWSDARRIVVGPTRVGVIDKQIDNGGSGRVGESAPAFEWVAPDGKRLALATLGKPAVVNFWATWCEPCKDEMPLLDRAAAAHPEIAFLAIDMDEDGAKVRSFLDDLGVTKMDALLDVGLATARRFGLASVPSTFFVDARGTIRHLQIGQLDSARLQSGLDQIR
jgi:cytochrome c biogenesis protein CcmG/thiol:disulfide interchange protein DsbE